MAELVLSPGGLRAVREWRPLSVSAFRVVAALRQAGVEPRTVLDVGANIGQFARAAVGTWPGADVVAFEPLPVAAAALRSALGALGQVHEVAVGDTDGTTSFHPHPYTLASSVLATTQYARDRYSWAHESGPIDVPMRRLDSLVNDVPLVRPALLKIDVQGFELHVLRGAVETLGQLDALVVEQSFEPYYEGQPPFGDVYDFLNERGWRLGRILDTRREGQLVVEVDCLYLRGEPVG